MTRRRTAIMSGVAVAAVILVPAGIAFTALGYTRHQDGVTIGGIIALVLGLACLRALSWVRRIRVLTEVGLSFHREEDASAAPPDDPQE